MKRAINKTRNESTINGIFDADADGIRVKNVARNSSNDIHMAPKNKHTINRRFNGFTLQFSMEIDA